MIDFAVNHLLADREELRGSVLQNPALSARPEKLDDGTEGAPFRHEEGSAPTLPPPTNAPDPRLEQTTPAVDTADGKRETPLQKISRMSPAAKIRLALLGNQEERFILIRDSNKAVARAVIQSPKLSDAEIEAYASMKNVTEEVLRLISIDRGFMKNYSVIRALAGNPRAPLDVSLPLLKHLKERDLKKLMIDKNISDTVRAAAAKLYTTRQSGRM